MISAQDGDCIAALKAMQDERDAARLERNSALLEVDRLTRIADKLLNHCDRERGECSECSKIVCPYECELHFHHDGCPACAEHESAIQP